MFKTGSQLGILTWRDTSPGNGLRKDRIFGRRGWVYFHPRCSLHARMGTSPLKVHRLLLLGPLFDWRPSTGNTARNDTGHCSCRTENRGTRSCPPSSSLWSGRRPRGRVGHRLLQFWRLRQFTIRPRTGGTPRPRQKGVAGMLQLVCQLGHTAATDLLEKSQLFSDFFQGRVPVPDPVLLILHNKLGVVLLPMRHGRDQSREEFIGNQPDNNRHRHRKGAQHYRVTPLRAVDLLDGECLTTHKHDQTLPSNDDELDTHEPVVSEHPLKDVEVVVQPTRAKEGQ